MYYRKMSVVDVSLLKIYICCLLFCLLKSYSSATGGEEIKKSTPPFNDKFQISGMISG